MSEKHRERGIRLSLDYEIEVRDRNGKLISKAKHKADPFLKNWILILQALFNNDATLVARYISLTDTGGASKNFYVDNVNPYAMVPFGVNAPATDSTFGIQVGASDTAFSKTQYGLISKIAHGSGSGQLMYGASSVEAVVDEDTTSWLRITRAFTNSSGGSVTVKEIGIAVVQNNQMGANIFIMVARDVLTSPQTVPDGGTLNVRYRLYISYV